jgi:hypothetical protein
MHTHSPNKPKKFKQLLYACQKADGNCFLGQESSTDDGIHAQGSTFIIVSIPKKGDKTDCNNYHGISLLSTSYKMLSNNLLSRLSPYIDEIIGDNQCGF